MPLAEHPTYDAFCGQAIVRCKEQMHECQYLVPYIIQPSEDICLDVRFTEPSC